MLDGRVSFGAAREGGMTDRFPKQRIGDLPGQAAARWPAGEALVFEGRRWTFREFAVEVDIAAKALMALGVTAGEQVALWMPNRPEWEFLLFAVAKIGAVLVPLNTRYRTADLSYAVRQSNSATLITVDRSGPVDYLGMLVEALPGLASKPRERLAVDGFPDLKRVVLFGGDTPRGAWNWRDVAPLSDQVSDAALAARAAEVDPDALAMVIYTSGTTGNPKGVMHSHICLRNVVDQASRFGVTERDRILCYLPLFHLYGLAESALLGLVTGAAQIVTQTFDPMEAIGLIERERATIIHGFDTHHRDLMLALEQRPADVSSLRLASLPAGMSSTQPIAEAAQKRLCRTVSGWGMSEAWAFATASFLDSTQEQLCEASGYPVAGMEIRVIEPVSGRDQPVGVQGELLVRGYMVTAGYYGKPEATAEAIDAEGWLHTGDTAVLREDGHIRFVGRYKDMLKVGGENVSPAEVEAWIMQLDAVAEVAVVGYPDPRLAEVAVAVIRLHEGASLTAEQVIAHCRGRIASFKIPRHAIFLAELPMTASGKVQKHKLRELALTTLGQPKVA
jgi:fatty-acyl-CoA synthase